MAGGLAKIASKLVGLAPGAGAALSLAGGIFNIVQGRKMMKEAKRINPDYFGINDPRLSGMESQYAKDMLGRAQTMLNARMTGAAARERQIQASRAGTQANIARGAVDPTMAMSAMLASQAQADDQSNQLFGLENQIQQQRDANLMNAQGVMISERDKALAEKNMKYQMDMSQKNALRDAGRQSIFGGISSMAGTLVGIGQQKQQRDYNNQYLSMMQKMYGAPPPPSGQKDG